MRSGDRAPEGEEGDRREHRGQHHDPTATARPRPRWRTSRRRSPRHPAGRPATSRHEQSADADQHEREPRRRRSACRSSPPRIRSRRTASPTTKLNSSAPSGPRLPHPRQSEEPAVHAPAVGRRSTRPPTTAIPARIAEVSAAVSSVPRKNSRRVTLIACENGNVRVSAWMPTTPKYQSGAWAPPPYFGSVHAGVGEHRVDREGEQEGAAEDDQRDPDVGLPVDQLHADDAERAVGRAGQ